jgi:Cof subfamily protein (haloacid dehalogenase superfamily)
MVTRCSKTLYVTDLDGTFLDNSHRVSEESAQTLNALLQRGLDFVVATARNYASTRELLQSIQYNNPLILANGALITDFDGNVLWHAAMDAALVRDLFNALKSFEGDLVWSSIKDNNHLIISEKSGEGVRRFEAFRRDRGYHQFVYGNTLESLLSEWIITLTLIADFKTAQAAEQAILTCELKDIVYAHIMPYPELEGLYTLTVQPQSTHKGAGVRALLERRHSTPDRIIAFGDQLNDLKLFEVADRGYAVSNGHETLKEIAYRVIGSCDTSSVARQIALLENGLEGQDEPTY